MVFNYNIIDIIVKFMGSYAPELSVSMIAHRYESEFIVRTKNITSSLREDFVISLGYRVPKILKRYVSPVEGPFVVTSSKKVFHPVTPDGNHFVTKRGECFSKYSEKTSVVGCTILIGGILYKACHISNSTLGSTKLFYLDEAVLSVFISKKPYNCHGVIHKNGKKTDNSIDNLMWIYPMSAFSTECASNTTPTPFPEPRHLDGSLAV